MKNRNKILIILVLIGVVLVSGCSYLEQKPEVSIIQDKYSNCNNYLSSENDYVAQSFKINASFINYLSLRVNSADQAKIIITVLEENISGKEIFNIEKNITESSDDNTVIDVPDLSVTPNKEYFLKITCPNCIHRISSPEDRGKPKNILVCFSYSDNNPYIDGQYLYKTVGYESDDKNLDLTFRIKGRT